MKKLDGGLLVMFEGSDGVGKTTQLHKAATALRDDGWDVRETRNLGGTPMGEALREVALSSIKRGPETDLYISAAIQNELIKAVNLDRQAGKIILLDRGPLSLAVYQVYGSGADEKLGWHYAELGMKKLQPELVILYTADLKTTRSRAKKRPDNANYFESKPLSFFERVTRGFDVAAKRYSPREIDANRAIEPIHEETMKLISTAIQQKQA